MDIREKAFVHEYIINGGNAYQAALKAGYKDGTAKHAYEWLQETSTNVTKNRYLPFIPELKEAIDDELDKLESDKIASEQEILQYLTAVMRREEHEHSVVLIHDEMVDWVKNEDTGKYVKKTTKTEKPQVVEMPTKVSDANKAAELLGKVRGIFRERVALDLSPIVIAGYDEVEE